MNIDEISRRRLLGIAGTGMTAAILAACAKDEDTPARRDPGRPRGRLGAGYDGVRVGARDHDRWHSGRRGHGGGGGEGTIKIGYVTPSTGALAPFAAADDFILGGVADFLAGGLMIGGTSYTVEIIVEDSQSDNRAVRCRRS